MGKKRLPIGKSDFKSLIEDNCYYVDKSLFIKDVVNGADILLYPRPRRFGKTLNLSMLRYFYENSEDNSHIFKELKIEKEKDIMEKQGKYPVIYITFKDVKESNFNKCMEKIKSLIGKLYSDFRKVYESEILNLEESKFYENILNQSASESKFEDAIKNLTEYLSKYYGEKVVILIDEYDMPLQGAFVNGYYNELIGFMRNLLSGGLKDNSYLEKSVLTGIMRIAKESIFSGLNNLNVFSILFKNSGDKFGILEGELIDILNYYNLEYELEEVKDWYNGYNFGGYTVYNPWSILNFVEKDMIRPYWVNTSGNDLIRELLKDGTKDVKEDMEQLIKWGKIIKELDDHIIYNEIDKKENTLWSFLLMSGYLTYENLITDEEKSEAELKIPNKEVMFLYKNEIIKYWFESTSIKYNLEKILKTLTKGDLVTFRKMFIEFCESAFSYFDVSGDEPEKFYHAFVLGIIVSLKGIYVIKSNRESGYGRYDIMLVPKDKKERGIIFEFKKIDRFEKETLELAMESAKKQIVEKKYEQELIDEGIEKVVRIAVVFEKKRVEVEIF